MSDGFRLMRVELGDSAGGKRANESAVECLWERRELRRDGWKPPHLRHVVVGSVWPIDRESRRQPIERLFERGPSTSLGTSGALKAVCHGAQSYQRVMGRSRGETH